MMRPPDLLVGPVLDTSTVFSVAGINNRKSAVVVWKNYPRVVLRMASLKYDCIGSAAPGFAQAC